MAVTFPAHLFDASIHHSTSAAHSNNFAMGLNNTLSLSVRARTCVRVRVSVRAYVLAAYVRINVIYIMILPKVVHVSPEQGAMKNAV